MEQNEITMPTKYDPQSIEKGRYKWWLEGKFFEAKDDDRKTAIHNRDSTTKRNRKASLRTCMGYNATRYFNTNEADARI